MPSGPSYIEARDGGRSPPLNGSKEFRELFKDERPLTRVSGLSSLNIPN
jgi:hypothetical protein